jgi:hypothetical protein
MIARFNAPDRDVESDLSPQREKLAVAEEAVEGERWNRLYILAERLGTQATVGIAQVLAAVRAFEIEHAGVERERGPHDPAANSRDDGHHVC